MIFEQAISDWRRHCPWQQENQVEQDLILHALIKCIYSDAFLSEHLAFRGGTCINKMYLPLPYRYSEDLDFVQIQAAKIGPVAERLKTIIAQVLKTKPQWESSKGNFRLNYTFLTEGTKTKQKIKIEINTREHFAIEGHVKKKIIVDSEWHSGEAEVVTFSFEELLATKMRALYQRRKGRDLFDLWVSQELKPDYKKVVKLFREYMDRENNKVSQKEFSNNLHLKMEMPTFLNDIQSLIRPKTEYEPHAAEKFVQEKIIQLLD